MATKAERIRELMIKKREREKQAHEIVLKLIETEVCREFLLEKSRWINSNHLDDVIEERKIGGICGWMLCDSKLDAKVLSKPQQFAIRGKKVLDISQRKAFCSSKCYARTIHFKKQLLTTPLWLRDEDDESPEIVILEESDETEMHGIVVNINGIELNDSEESEESDKSGEDDES